MNKKSVLVLLLGLLWFGGGKAEEKQEKIEPPDWYKAGYVAALQDRNSAISSDEFSFFKEPKEWLPVYLSPEQRNFIVNKLIKRLVGNDSAMRKGAIKALGLLQAKEAIPKLIEYLADDDRDVRIIAIKTLVQINYPAASGRGID